MMTQAKVDGGDDGCLRCGYNLSGIANDQPCPECGLLAERSRRITDELHQTRPKWLKRLSRGVWLIVLALLLPVPLLMAPQAAVRWVWDHQDQLIAWGVGSSYFLTSTSRWKMNMLALITAARATGC